MSRWLMAVVLLAIAGCLAWMLWPRRLAAVPVSNPAVVTIQEATPAQSASAKYMSGLALEDIRPEMVNLITQENGRWVLIFQDGSKREVYPFEIGQLPEQLRFQMEYKRGGS
jgi:hypothetical protein